MKFTCAHHYENNVKAAGDVSNAARTRRLAQEATTLSTSLPLSAGSSVFVRCDEERLDIMKVCLLCTLNQILQSLLFMNCILGTFLRGEISTSKPTVSFYA